MADSLAVRRLQLVTDETPERLRELADWLETAETLCLARAAELYSSSDLMSTNAYVRGGLSEALRGGGEKLRSLALDIEIRCGSPNVAAAEIAAGERRAS